MLIPSELLIVLSAEPQDAIQPSVRVAIGGMRLPKSFLFGKTEVIWLSWSQFLSLRRTDTFQATTVTWHFSNDLLLPSVCHSHVVSLAHSLRSQWKTFQRTFLHFLVRHGNPGWRKFFAEWFKDWWNLGTKGIIRSYSRATCELHIPVHPYTLVLGSGTWNYLKHLFPSRVTTRWKHLWLTPWNCIL